MNTQYQTPVGNTPMPAKHAESNQRHPVAIALGTLIIGFALASTLDDLQIIKIPPMLLLLICSFAVVAAGLIRSIRQFLAAGSTNPSIE